MSKGNEDNVRLLRCIKQIATRMRSRLEDGSYDLPERLSIELHGEMDRICEKMNEWESICEEGER